jgi:hypothetical protein
MKSAASTASRSDARLWAIALGLSLLVNAGILLAIGFISLKSAVLQKTRPVPPAVATETTVTIFPEMIQAAAKAADATAAELAASAASGKPSFARTSEDQLAPAPEKPAFIGERDTQATSDRSPDATAPPLPSQAGVAPRDREDFETTESDYQDGKLASDSISKPLPATPTPPSPADPATADPAVAETAPSGEKTEMPGKDDSKSSPPPREPLLEGPNPVDVAVPQDTATSDAIKPTPPKSPKDGRPEPKASDSPKPATAAATTDDPGFRGYQRKTAIVGSISRTGRSALDVADSPLGRYQALISRAVEQEWQRNCVRHRDFITPGFLTVRFFIETNGRVRSVQFVGDMETGEVQKGFTLNSIRDADIPPMPAAVRKDFAKEPLELIFNFYF